MSKVEKFARIVIKRSDSTGVEPTLPLTGVTSEDDHTLSPAWRTTDLYIGEYFLNQVDERLWIRSGEDNIKEVLFVNNNGDSLSYDAATETLYATNLSVSGTKNFRITHPTDYNKYLVYASVESPYNSIQLNGKSSFHDKFCKVELPDYINDLICQSNVVVQITNIKHHKNICVEAININEKYFELSIDDYDNEIYDFYWTLIGERIDIEKLKVEVDKSEYNFIKLKDFLK